MICLRFYVFHMYVSVAIESDDRCIIVIIGLCIRTIHIYFIGKTSAIMAVGLFIKSLIQTEKTTCPAIAKRVKENTVHLIAVYNWVIPLRLYLLFIAENYRKTTKWLAKTENASLFFRSFAKRYHQCLCLRAWNACHHRYVYHHDYRYFFSNRLQSNKMAKRGSHYGDAIA